MTRTLIVGLGNPILSDDSVGLHIARLLREKLSGEDGVKVIELYAGGIRLIDVLAGWDRAILVDAMLTGTRRPGEWLSFQLAAGEVDGMPVTRNASSTHDMNFATAIEMGRMLGMPMPAEVWVWGVEAADVETFSEKPTEAVSLSVGRVAEEVAAAVAPRGAIHQSAGGVS